MLKQYGHRQHDKFADAAGKSILHDAIFSAGPSTATTGKKATPINAEIYPYGVANNAGPMYDTL